MTTAAAEVSLRQATGDAALRNAAADCGAPERGEKRRRPAGRGDGALRMAVDDASFRAVLANMSLRSAVENAAIAQAMAGDGFARLSVRRTWRRRSTVRRSSPRCSTPPSAARFVPRRCSPC